MPGTYFDIHYEPESVRSSRGAMWVVSVGLTGRLPSGQCHISHDCGSVAEIEHVICDMEADLKRMRKKAAALFEKNDEKKRSASNA